MENMNFQLSLIYNLSNMNRLSNSVEIFTFILIIPLLTISSFAQKDLNNYQTLLSQGEMPQDFKTSVADKVAQDLLRTDLVFPSKTEAQAYWTEVHTELNNAFYSGDIIYGDEISNYVREVAANLLKTDPKLLKKLRFYTIKSNEVNAFSTAPGIIFVTTGLISQLSSEAQLAFILSHEIAHYEKNHSYNEYINLKKAGKIKRRDQVLKLSQFSKEQEFEADEAAIKRYYDLGYSREDLLGTFDILMYSYLPFDEIVFPNDYFNTDQFYIPLSRINKEIKEITAREDYNDNYHTHPNIKKRKEAIQFSLEKYSQWGKTHFILDEKTFREAVKTCRFEDVRTNLIQGNPFNALYSIFLLERLHPNNLFLEHMKAGAWLSIQQTGHIIHERFDNPKIEGESSKLNKFLKQAKRIELATIGLRILYDLKNKYPDDAYFESTYNNYLKELSTTTYFELSKFQKLNYHQAASEALLKKTEPASTSIKDSVKTEGDKYSRIREKRETQQTTVAFDSTEYAIYGISDIILDSVFIKTFKALRAKNDSIKEAEKDFFKLTPKEQELAKREMAKKQAAAIPTFKDVLLIEPEALIFSDKTVPDWEKEKGQTAFFNFILNTCQKNGFNPVLMQADSISKLGTEALNEYVTYLSYFEQVWYMNDGKPCLPVDTDLIKNYNTKRGISHILSTNVYYAKDYHGLNMEAILIDLNKSDVLLSGATRSDFLSPSNYTPFFNQFFALMKNLK